MNLDAIKALLRPYAARIGDMIQRCRVTRVDDATRRQTLQVIAAADATRAGLEHFQQYGFAASPLPGAEGVLLAFGGHADHAVVIAVGDRRYRLRNLEAGEVALYTDEGDEIRIRRGGTIEVKASTEVKLTAPHVVLVNDSDSMALASRTDARLAHLEAAFNVHVHATAAPGPPVPPTPIPGVIPVETPPPGSGFVGTVASASVKGAP